MIHQNANVFRLSYAFWQQYHASIHKVWSNGELKVEEGKNELRYQPKEIQLFDQILYVSDGAIAIVSKKKRILISHGSCCVIPAGIEYALYPECINAPTSHYMLAFPTTLSENAASFNSNPNRRFLRDTWFDPFILDKANQAAIQVRLNFFMHQPEGLGVKLVDKHIFIPSLNILVYDLFILAFFADQTQGIVAQQTIPPWLRQLCAYMQIPKHFILGTKEMERLSGKSTIVLYRAFVKHFDITPLVFVNQQKCVYAAEKLSHTDQDIINIAYDIGFSSVSYFYKFFKKHYKISPAAYRISARQTQNFVIGTNQSNDTL